MKKYNDYGINPFKSLVGTLPILIQIPILLGLYACIKYPTSGGIIEHPHFLWFNLMHTDLIMTFIAAFTLLHSTFGQCNALSKRRKTHILCHDGIIAIIYYLCITTICFTLSLYWAISATFLIIQMHFAHSHYAKVGKAEVNNSNDKLSNNVKIRLTMIRLKVIKTFHQYSTVTS